MTDDEFDRLWRNLVERSHRSGRAPLSEQEQHFYSVNLLRGAVPRSGFIGYFENSKSSEIADAKEGLREMKLDAVLSVLEEAQATVFGDTILPNDSTQLEIFPQSLTEEEYEDASDRLDERLTSIEEKLYEHEDEVWAALIAYADRHRLEPRG